MFRVFLISVIVALLASLLSCVTLVRPDERAVVRRFGRILPGNPGPGLLFGLPWGMDRVDRVSLKDRYVTVGWSDSERKDEADSAITPGQMLTGDHNLVNVQAVIEYRVVFDQVDRFVLMEANVEPLLVRAAESALAEWLAGHDVDEAILRGKRQLEPFLKQTLDKWIARYDLGVQIDRASILLVDPPSEVREAFNEVGQAHARRETKMRDAETKASRLANKAKEDKFRIESETKAFRNEKEEAALADADNFLIRLKEYRRLSESNPRQLYNLWLDEVTRLYAQLRRTGRVDLLDNYIGSDGLNITQFPLPKKPQ